MIRRIDYRERRILRFPAVRPCDGPSPETLLQCLITSSENISRYQPKSFASQRRNAREIIRQVSILSIFFDEIRGGGAAADNSLILSLSEIHAALQKIELLLSDCSRRGSKLFILMKSHEASAQFRALAGTLATAIDVLPSIDEVSVEVKEMLNLLSAQARRAKMEVESEDEETMKSVILILNQFENKFEPDPFLTRKILTRLDIGSWAECHEEIEFLEDEIRAAHSGSSDDVHLLTGLMGFLCYCRATLFDDCDFDLKDSPRSSVAVDEALSCLNPRDFRCPISLELMTDPVTVSTGQTYDRPSIAKWLKSSGSPTCPKTGESLADTYLVPNTNLKKVIHRFCAEHGVSLAPKSRAQNRDISLTVLPGCPAHVESVRLLSVYLTLTMSHGSSHQRKKAALEARLLTKSNLFNRSCLTDAGAVEPLIELLGSTDGSLQENAISALLKLSKHPNGQKEIVENEGLGPILNVLKNGAKNECKQIAAAVVFYLCSANEYRKSIGENPEVIPSLLEQIKGGTNNKKNSIAALFALLIYDGNRGRAIEAGAVPALMNLLEASGKIELKVDALAVLSTLANSFEGSLEILQQSSALTLVIRCLRAIEAHQGKEYCVSILHSLCLNGGDDVVSVLAEDGSLMSELYSMITEGTSRGGRKARALIKILQRFCESRSADEAREVRRGRYVNVR